MKKKLLSASIILVLLILAAVGYRWQSQVQAADSEEALDATGVIEARQVIMAPEIGGQIVEVLVEEGQQVTPGQTLVRLDDSMVLSQRNQALASLRAAQANLALLEAGATLEEIAVAEAAVLTSQGYVTAAKAAVAQAEINLETARLMEQVDSTVAKAEAALAQAQGGVDVARAELARAQAELARLQAGTRPEEIAMYQALVNQTQSDYLFYENWHLDWFIEEDVGGPPEERARFQRESARGAWDAALARLDLAKAGATEDEMDAASAAVWAGGAQVSVAKAVVDAAKATLAESQAVPQTMQQQVALAEAQVAAAQAQVKIAEGQLAQAEAELNRLKAGFKDEEIEAARAQVEAAQAHLDMLDVQFEKFTISAPGDGVVLTRSVEPGEAVMPGTTLLEIGQLDLLELTVYLPEDRYGLVIPGQDAFVSVDTYPDQFFPGTVLRVADEAEFTPTNIQTKDDRVRLVYAVVISLENPGQKLKPGMIADATFVR